MLRRTALAATILFTLLAGYSHPVRAAIDEAGAKHLKSLFADMLNTQSEQMKAQGGKLVEDGDLMVESAGTYYAVTLPHLTTVAADGSSVNIGMIVINAIPDDKPKQWKMTVALPTPLVWYDAKGARKFTVDVGRQSFAGIWQEKLENFSKLKAEYSDVKITAADKSSVSTLGNFTVLYDLSSNKDGTWSGPTSFTASNLSVKSSDGSTAGFATLEGAAKIDGYSPSSAATYRAQLFTSGTPDSFYGIVSGMVGKIWNGVSFRGSVENLTATAPPAGAGIPGRLLLPHASFTVGLDGFRQNKVTLQTALHYDDLTLQPAPAGADVMVPAKFNLDLTIQNLPYEKLAALIRSVTSLQTPELAQMARMKALFDLPKILQSSGAQTALRDLSFSNPLYGTVASGRLISDPRAAQGATGQARVEITGLENVTGAVSQQLQNPQTPPAAQAPLRKAATVLTLLQVIGQPGTGSRGQPTRIYNLTLTAAGEIMLNGADINTLFPDAAAPALKTTPKTH